MSEYVKVNQENSVCVITLDRPDAFNAFNLNLLKQLAGHLTACAADKSVRAVVITGNGRAFCAGGDLKWALGFEGGAAAGFHTLASQFHLAVLEIRRMAKPVIAAINGVAAGGGFSLALACDFRVIGKSAKLVQAYTSSGLCIDGGGTFALPRLVGLARALEIAAFDEAIAADKALQWGLVNSVVETGQELEESLKMAGQLCRRSVNSFALCKQLFTDSYNTSFETQMELERRALAGAAEHPDGQEGLAAFTEKRKPEFN